MNFQFTVTRDCNFNCTYCYQKEKSSVVMSEAIIDKTCDFVYTEISKDAAVASTINISGGECFLYPDKVKKIIATINDRCKKNGIVLPFFEISTNASLLTDEIDEFLSCNNVSLYIGFDGIASSQNLNRLLKEPHGKTFKKCFENIKHLHSAFGNIPCTINSVISNNNAHLLNKNFDFLYHEFSNFSFSYNIAYNVDWYDKALKILESELKSLANKYIQILMAKNTEFRLRIFDKQIELNIAEFTGSNPLCGAGIAPLGISPEGHFEICTQLMGTKAEKDFVAGDIEQGINNEKMKSFREGLSVFGKLETCKECRFNRRCFNYCPSINYLSSGNVHSVSFSQCEINKMLIYVADFIINELDAKMPFLLESRFKV